MFDYIYNFKSDSLEKKKLDHFLICLVCYLIPKSDEKIDDYYAEFYKGLKKILKYQNFEEIKCKNYNENSELCSKCCFNVELPLAEYRVITELLEYIEKRGFDKDKEKLKIENKKIRSKDREIEILKWRLRWCKRDNREDKMVMNSDYEALRRDYEAARHTMFTERSNWDLGTDLAKFLYKAVANFKKHYRYGYPEKFTPEEWEKVLDEILWGLNELAEWGPDCDKIDSLDKDALKMYHERLKHSLKLFAENFADMWD